MKAMVLKEFSKTLSLEDVEKPCYGEHDVLVKVKAAGLCGTDLKIQQGKIPVKELPLIQGHEVSGIIAETGSQVKNFKVGDEVLVSFYIPCNECELCKMGRKTICENLIGRLGFELNGGFAEYVKVPESNLIRKPKELSFSEAAIVSCSMGTIYHALLKRAKIREGDYIAMIGAGGGLGLHAIQIAKSFNAKVIGIDVTEEKLKLMKKYGADETIDASKDNWSQRIVEISGGRGADKILEFVSRKETVEEDIKSLRKGGKLVLVAYSDSVPLQINSLKVVLNELEILGTRAGTKEEIEKCVELIVMGKLKPVISKTFSLEEINQAMSILKEGKLSGRITLKVS